MNYLLFGGFIIYCSAITYMFGNYIGVNKGLKKNFEIMRKLYSDVTGNKNL